MTPAKSPEAFAFVEVSGTLVDADTLIAFGAYVDRAAALRPAANAHLKALQIGSVLGLVGKQLLRDATGATLRELDRSLLADLGERFVDQVCLERLNGELVTFVHALRGVGIRVVIVTDDLAAYTEPLIARLGMPEIVTSSLDLGPGASSRGAAKIQLIRERFAPTEDSIRRSYAFSSAVADLPLLEWVGHPVAIWPEPQLAKIAEDRGWQSGVDPEIDRACLPAIPKEVA